MGIAHLRNIDALPVFHVGTLPAGEDGAAGRDLCVIAHRFGYALVFGAAALNEVPVLGHRCDNPLCQRIGPGHVQASTHALNRRAYLARRFVAGNPLGDARGAQGRSKELRDLTRADPAAVAAEQARLLRLGCNFPSSTSRWLVFFACRRPGWGEQFGRMAMAGFVVCLGSSR